ncbi:hypothetical protein [Flavobacterium maritimum]|uniref:hypothetical protein n=1 Tax=Flavobacterium maritimum TaxID=3149042 RepID=UPI0032B57CBC
MAKQEGYPRYVDVMVGEKYKGLYSCDCHLFENYAELRKANLQKFVPGQKVKHRCNGKEGVIESITGKYIYFNHKSPLWGTAHIEELILIK